jgi:enediyne biosynthesis protein E4
VRRAIIAVPFFVALAAAVRLDRGPVRVSADATRPGFMLHDETAAAGIHFVHHRPTFDKKIANIEPHVAALGASVSVGDFDGDGWPDLYFTNSRFGTMNALYHNRGDGTFEDVAASAGLADLNRPGEGVSMGSVWGDFDNDGREDLLVYRYGYLALFKNIDGHHFQDVTEAAGLHRWMNCNSAIWIDYDRDGLLDLYVTGYFRNDIDLWHLSTTKIMHNSFEFATNGGKNLMFHNLGHGKFEDVTDKLGLGSTRWTLAAASADLNEDGWPDIYLANDYGPEELYLNDHGRRFTLSTAGLESESKSGMSVALGDVYNRGHLDVFVTNISERGYLFQNNNLRVNELTDRGRGSGRFHNMADAVVADAGWAWGAQFGDLNNDGTNELFVANGFISGDPKKSYWYSMSKIAGANARLFEDASTWPAFGNASLSGYERSRVYLNRGLGGWVDVASTVGVSDTYDGRAVALADLSNRGALDVIVANQNQPALLYRNRPDSANHWIAFSLVGTRSNRSAIGAEVVVESGGTKQRRVVDGGMGFASQNDRRLHFGLGRTEWVDRVVIYWPSGTQQVLTNPAVDQFHTITEPKP